MGKLSVCVCWSGAGNEQGRVSSKALFKVSYCSKCLTSKSLTVHLLLTHLWNTDRGEVSLCSISQQVLSPVCVMGLRCESEVLFC